VELVTEPDPQTPLIATAADDNGSSPPFSAADGRLRMLLVSGSVRTPSHTRALIAAVEMALEELDIATTVWDLRAALLPVADPAYHHRVTDNPDPMVQRLVALAEACDAFVLATPIYHNSYSGVLKNALDNLAIDQFAYKPVALLSHGGRGNTQAVDHLRIVVRGLHGVATPTQVCTGDGDYGRRPDGDFELIAEDMIERVRRFSAELMLFARQFRLARGLVAR